jgi:hypothetical protein
MRKWILVGVLAAMLASCGDDDCCATPQDAASDATLGDAGTGLTEVAHFASTTNRALDLLFVVDDSPSMLDKQNNMTASFSAFVSVLATAPGGLPDLHIGVITTDVGTKGADDAQPGPAIGQPGNGGCANLGDAGILQTNGATSLSDRYISDVSDGAGGRTTNYTGTLASVFTQLASVGATGCGFEQPLHAIRLALDSTTTQNAGFLRSNARLGIILLSDEDDCSLKHSTLFGPDSTTLGPLQSFRCTRFGVTCDVGGATPDAMNQVGTKQMCRSNESSAYVADVARYVSFLQGLKADRRDIAFGAIVGAETPYQVEARSPPGGGTATPALAHSCMYSGAQGQEVADPPARIADFASRLPRSTVASVCSSSLSSVMTSMAQRMKSLVGESCLDRAIAMPANCEAFDVTANGTETALPACTASSGLPCFTIVTDATACPAGPHLKADVMRIAAPSADTWTSVRCAL